MTKIIINKIKVYKYKLLIDTKNSSNLFNLYYSENTIDLK